MDRRYKQEAVTFWTTRVLAEVTVTEPDVAVAEARRILAALGPVPAPILLHGEDAGASFEERVRTTVYPPGVDAWTSAEEGVSARIGWLRRYKYTWAFLALVMMVATMAIGTTQ